MDGVLRVASVNIAGQKGTGKHPVSEIRIEKNGVKDDAHYGQECREISVLGQESIDRFAKETGRKTAPGDFAENITTRGMDLGCVSVLDRFVSGTLVLEVSQIGKTCHGNTCAIFKEVGTCVMPKEGIFCRVIEGGALKPGDRLEYQPRELRIAVVTMSDRASRGEYEDRSGPLVQDLLEEFFQGRRWHPRFERVLLPDDAARLGEKLDALCSDGTDIIITCGGTGVGPRDVTPEVVTAFCEKTVPGIMDSIRAKFGSEKPNALLSRSVAGIKGTTIVYALPGSVGAVREYVPELLKTMEHIILMLHGLDVHGH